MNSNVLNEIINILGNETAIKIACNISCPGSIDLEVDKKKIERARYFGIIQNDSLELTEMGKIFAVKQVFDIAEQIYDERLQEDDEEDDEDFDDDEDWDDEDWDEDDDWDDDEDWEEDDEWTQEEDDENEEDEENFKSYRRH